MQKNKPAKAVLGRYVTSDYQPTALHDHVYAEMRRALLDGVFEPGEALSLRSVAESLGTSPMPVRDAVRRLAAEGALEMRSNRTMAVPMMTKAQFDELTQLRLELEGRAAELAVEDGSPELLPTLEAIEEKMKGARQQSVAARLATNREFHFALYRASRSELRMRMIELLWLRSAPFTHISFAKGESIKGGTNHWAVIDAVRQGDPIAARRAIEADLTETYVNLLGKLEFPQLTSVRGGAEPAELASS